MRESLTIVRVEISVSSQFCCEPKPVLKYFIKTNKQTKKGFLIQFKMAMLKESELTSFSRHTESTARYGTISSEKNLKAV